MPKYLVLADYNTEGIKRVLDKGGTSRRDALEALCESVGGSLESFYFAFGDTDAYVTVDLPDNSTAAVAKLVMKPARIPPIISGNTMRRTVRSLVAPRFSAASSSDTEICCNAA